MGHKIIQDETPVPIDTDISDHRHTGAYICIYTFPGRGVAISHLWKTCNRLLTWTKGETKRICTLAAFVYCPADSYNILACIGTLYRTEHNVSRTSNIGALCYFVKSYLFDLTLFILTFRLSKSAQFDDIQGVCYLDYNVFS